MQLLWWFLQLAKPCCGVWCELKIAPHAVVNTCCSKSIEDGGESESGERGRGRGRGRGRELGMVFRKNVETWVLRQTGRKNYSLCIVSWRWRAVDCENTLDYDITSFISVLRVAQHRCERKWPSLFVIVKNFHFLCVVCDAAFHYECHKHSFSLSSSSSLSYITSHTLSVSRSLSHSQI